MRKPNSKFYLALLLAFILISCSEDNKGPINPGQLPINGTIKLEGGEGGVMAQNSVYFDFSTGEQTVIERSSWHLGFHCGDQFGVILNNTLGSRAIEAKNNVTVSTVLDSVSCRAYKNDLSLGMGSGSFNIVDTIGYDLSKTVIKENKTYIYDAGDAMLELYKVQVVKKDDNTYTLSYALWNSSDVKTINITKKPDYRFIGVSLVNHTVLNMQPKKSQWDIVWGRNTYISEIKLGVPFVISDVIFSNQDVQVAEVSTETKSYKDFAVIDLATVKYSDDIGTIGTEWRSTSGHGSTASVKDDRFYILKDNEGNVYKIRFISMSEQDGGKRGYPEFEYELLK